MNLGLTASLSYLYSMVDIQIPCYPFLASDYPSMLCIFDHHITITAFLIIGSAAHASIGIIADNFKSTQDTWMQFLNHRDVFVGHLICSWFTFF
jgi:photosystem I P700 chlorophyll a apoprotein A1